MCTDRGSDKSQRVGSKGLRLFLDEATKGRNNKVMPNLTLAIIFKNEANYIENCIRSVLNIVDEVIAVDSGSNDGSDEIVKGMSLKDPKIKYHLRQWPGDFSNQRNFAIDQATGDWILFLDADERLAVPDHKKLLEAISKPEFDAYELPILNYTLDLTEVGYVPNSEAPYPYGYVVTRLHRLFRRRSEFRYEGILHEKIEPSLFQAKANLSKIDISIHHLGRVKESEEGLRTKRYEFYLELAQKKLNQNPSDSQAHWELGVILQKMNRLSEALQEFEAALKLSPGTEEFEIYLGLALFQMADWSKLSKLSFQSSKARFFQIIAAAQSDKNQIEALDEYRKIYAQATLIIFELSLKHHRADRIASDRSEALKIFDKSGLIEFLEGAQKRRDGDFYGARAQLEVSIRKGCKTATLEFLLATTQAKDFEGALQFYHKQTEAEKAQLSGDARKVLAYAAQQAGKKPEDYLH